MLLHLHAYKESLSFISLSYMFSLYHSRRQHFSLSVGAGPNCFFHANIMRLHRNCFHKVGREVNLAPGLMKLLHAIHIHIPFNMRIVVCAFIQFKLHFVNQHPSSIHFYHLSPTMSPNIGPHLHNIGNLILLLCFFRWKTLTKACLTSLIILYVSLK